MTEELLNRVVLDHKIMVGKAVIRETRIPVELIVKLAADGQTEHDILREYPQLTKDDIKASLLYAAKLIRNEEVYPVAPSETS